MNSLTPRPWKKTPNKPEGLVYRNEFLSEDEERRYLAAFGTIDFHEVRMKGVVAKRTTRHFGWTYGYESWKIAPTDPIPGFLVELRAKCAGTTDLPAEAFEEVLVSRYPAGAGIGWHRDAPMFGEPVVGVSFLSPCVMRFRREAPEERLVYAQTLLPRSLYHLAGAARKDWQHSIPSSAALRYSVTFRTIKRKP